LTREELLALGRSGNDMERNASELRLSTPARQDFTRDELSVELTMRLHGPEVSSGKPVWRRTADSLKSLCFINDSAVRADAVVNAAPGVTLEVKPRVEQEGNGVEIGAPLSPGQFSAGRKECVLRVVVNGIEKEFRQSFAIHPARPQSNYGLMLWSCRTDPESLRRYRDAGVRIVDVRGFRSCPVIRDLESFGMTASAHYGNYHPDPHPAAPANWDKMMFDAQVTAPVLASQAHVIRYCLLNSEVSGRDDVKASPKVMQALKEDIGLDAPPFSPGAGFTDLSIRPKLDLKAGNSGNGRTAGVGRGKTACPGTPWARSRSENS
jgi:hypothetical protein